MSLQGNVIVHLDNPSIKTCVLNQVKQSVIFIWLMALKGINTCDLTLGLLTLLRNAGEVKCKGVNESLSLLFFQVETWMIHPRMSL